MIDHVTLLVTDYDRSKAFYLAALAPLGYTLCMELTQQMVPTLPIPRFCGIGPGGKPVLWLRPSAEAQPHHVAFTAQDRGAVDRFHSAALGAGGRDNGAPGPRPVYHPGYYGAFVLDPDGYNVEAVSHKG